MNRLKSLIKSAYHSSQNQPLWFRVSAVAFAGIFCGLCVFLVHVSNFFSYLSDSPQTCVNCHIMVPQYVTWFHSSHREAATCNDCHVPQTSIFATYGFKAADGMRHAAIFTIRGEDQAIMIKNAGRDAVQKNCLRCHENLFDQTAALSTVPKNIHRQTQRPCWECHREVTHGTVRSLSSTPLARVPLTQSMVPVWLKSLVSPQPQKQEAKP